MLRRTRLGLAMRAIAQDGRVAGLMGIDTNRVVALAFGVGAAVGGVGGVLTGIYYNSVDISMGYSAGLKGFSAMVIGGMGSLPGAILGGFVLGTAETAATAVFWSGLPRHRGLQPPDPRPDRASRRTPRHSRDPQGVTSLEPGATSEPPRAPASIRPRWTSWTKRQQRTLTRERLALGTLLLAALLLPAVVRSPYVLHVAVLAGIYVVLTLSLNLVTGFCGQFSLGHAGSTVSAPTPPRCSP